MNNTNAPALVATFDVAQPLGLNRAESVAWDMIATEKSFATLDEAQTFLSRNFSALRRGWFIYRGGSHVALHRGSNNPRLLMIAETR